MAQVEFAALDLDATPHIELFSIVLLLLRPGHHFGQIALLSQIRFYCVLCLYAVGQGNVLQINLHASGFRPQLTVRNLFLVGEVVFDLGE